MPWTEGIRLSFDGTRRWFHLECNPQYDDYQQAALRQSIRILKMLFEHGIETVISPIFSDDLLDRGDRYIVQALEGMALLANDEEILSFYKEHEVHVLFMVIIRKDCLRPRKGQPLSSHSMT